MEQILKTKKLRIALRIALILVMIAIFTVAIQRVIAHELKGAMWFFIAGFLITVPELFIITIINAYKGSLTTTTLSFSYFFKPKKDIAMASIIGYSTTSQYTKAGIIKGVIVYLNNKQKMLVTELNIVSVLPLIEYLNHYQIRFFGMEEPKHWYLKSKYKY